MGIFLIPIAMGAISAFAGWATARRIIFVNSKNNISETAGLEVMERSNEGEKRPRPS